ncbi:MAG TPA: hypothetical protein DCQ26_12390 [Marinilabiliales bacterium]|nr:MAG: hypothetical protein A2W95_02595 [Bacteroidetes bacterium GWA2_40_14]OFX56836.1 MAG: hypothetical protein A2W84_11265 [Bacteroidetes bacterium GWC2_40_13]OFX76048.1 MAG: hypothetical protein A2W96_01200 [Bacteroidetes bacterium GWD2_40_43]OFX94338.1 MAG: hypothetical protein A2W97_19420 [Bacteroidetes bacterium GWE2_40_63]OFY18816.1 MAG: hypothetical protein A2W88_06185 [Bacteroidetes bacterium GWF2_40_13]OFZ24792.1 MAG: hypothetical protein A2437_15750 [Bacteroidetes bacterium RIFOXYC
MANLGFTIRVALGMLPKTDKIESAQHGLQQEFVKLQEFKDSVLLQEFQELKKFVESEEFLTNKKNILGLDYKKTEEFKKEQNYFKLSKNKEIINYFKVLESADYHRFLEVEKSEELKEFQELNSYLESKAHHEIVEKYDARLKEEQGKLKTYQQQKKSKAIKDHISTSNSSKLKLLNEVVGSEQLAEYQSLLEFVNSKQLQEFKEALAQQLALEMAKKEQVKQLSKNPEVKAFLKKKEPYDDEKPSLVAEYEELKAYVQSSDYPKQLDTLRYKNTDQFVKESRFKTLAKDTKLVQYFKFESSAEYKTYLQFNDSKEWTAYQELEAYVTSPLYQENIEKSKYSNSDEYKSEERFNQLKINDSIKFWQRYGSSKPFGQFLKTSDSALLKEFESLKELVTSDKFQEYKSYMLDKQKWQKTEEFTKESRFLELKNSEDIKWYASVVGSTKFNELNAWRLTFEDDFTSGKVDEEKWMNSYFWGKMLLNDRYVLAGDKHYYTNNKNVELNGTTLKIITKKENSKGKVWHPVHGFFERDFEYTSGMLSTAHSFRQKYGKFEAKIKIDANFPVYQAFWLKGEKILPEVDVFKFNMDKRNRFQMSNIWGDANDFKKARKATSKINGSAFAKDYFIYSLEWSPEKLIWKINGMEVFTTTSGIPEEPLYMMLSAGIQNNTATEQLPSAFEIDWVRCYEKV